MTQEQLITSDTAQEHCIIIKLKLFDVIVIIIYKSPKFPNPTFIHNLADVLQNISGKIVVAGDFNINVHNSDSRLLTKLMDKYKLVSLFRNCDVSTDYGTLIDNCFSNVPEIQGWFYECYYSYHKPICIVWPKY